MLRGFDPIQLTDGSLLGDVGDGHEIVLWTFNGELLPAHLMTAMDGTPVLATGFVPAADDDVDSADLLELSSRWTTTPPTPKHIDLAFLG